MKLFVTEVKEERTETTIEVDVSQLDNESKGQLLLTLFEDMSEEAIQEQIDNSDNMCNVIYKNHVYFENQKIKEMIWILNGDVDHNDLEKDLMSLIEKYDLKRWLTNLVEHNKLNSSS